MQLDRSDGDRKVIVDDRHYLGNNIINLLSSSLMTVYTDEHLNPDGHLRCPSDTIDLSVTLPLNTVSDTLRVGKRSLQPCSPMGAAEVSDL